LGRDIHFKLLTLVFAFVALIAISACAVASSPSTAPEISDPEPTEVPEDSSSTDNIAEPEPTPTPEPEPEEPAASDDEDDLDAGTSDDDARSNDDDAADDEVEEEVAEEIPGNPSRLKIDSIDVDAPFEYVGIDDDGNMGVPEGWDNVAWYEPGTVPGDVGNSVIAGHYDSDTGPAVFYDLNELEEGDTVTIITEDDEELVFEITEIESVHVDDADTSKIFGSTDERNLNLITCEGVWDTSEGMYDHRLIVYTTLVDG
jgi:sortase A